MNNPAKPTRFLRMAQTIGAAVLVLHASSALAHGFGDWRPVLLIFGFSAVVIVWAATVAVVMIVKKLMAKGRQADPEARGWTPARFLFHGFVLLVVLGVLALGIYVEPNQNERNAEKHAQVLACVEAHQSAREADERALVQAREASSRTGKALESPKPTPLPPGC